MTPQKNSPSKQMAIIALCAAVLAGIAFCLPMYAYGDVLEFNGFDLMELPGDISTSMIIALAGGAGALAVSVLGLFKRKLIGIAAVFAALALGGILYGFLSEEMLEYANVGFWLFAIGEGACFALSLFSMNRAMSE